MHEYSTCIGYDTDMIRWYAISYKYRIQYVYDTYLEMY